MPCGYNEGKAMEICSCARLVGVWGVGDAEQVWLH